MVNWRSIYFENCKKIKFFIVYTSRSTKFKVLTSVTRRSEEEWDPLLLCPSYNKKFSYKTYRNSLRNTQILVCVSAHARVCVRVCSCVCVRKNMV